MLFRSDRKSTRLNSSHLVISYAVFCLKKKKRHQKDDRARFMRSLAKRDISDICRVAWHVSSALVSAPVLFCITFSFVIFFFFNDTATTEIYTLSLHDALPI